MRALVWFGLVGSVLLGCVVGWDGTLARTASRDSQVAGEKFSFFLEKSFTFYFEKSESFLTPLLVPENQTSASCLLLGSQCSTLPQPTLTVRTFISITIPYFCSSYRLWISPSPRIFSPASLQLPLPSSTSHHTHQHSDMYRLFSTAGVIAMTSYIATAWTSTTMPQRRATTLPSTPDASNPCWQDNYDSEDDCLSTIYSASFVAEEWIKSMPCGKVCLQYYTAFLLVLIHFCFIRTSHLSLRNL